MDTFFTGSKDLDNHVNSLKHRKAVQTASTSKSIVNFVIPKFTPLDNKIRAAEGVLAFHVVKHHHSFLSQNSTASLLREIFPDSQIATKISCSRTKVEAIICNVLSSHVQDIVYQDLQIECNAHIPHNSAQHGLSPFELFDVDTLAFKTYQYFSLYTVRTENLEAFCDFVEIFF